MTALLVAGYAFWPREEGLAEEKPVAEKTEFPIETPTEKSTESNIEDFQKPSENNVSKTEIESTSKIENLQNQPKVAPKTTEKTKPTPAPASIQVPKKIW